jgi:hypothetical protein
VYPDVSHPVVRDLLDRREREVTELAYERSMRWTERDTLSQRHVRLRDRMRWVTRVYSGGFIAEAFMSRAKGVKKVEEAPASTTGHLPPVQADVTPEGNGQRVLRTAQE